jgi:hypothetical protein
MKATIRIQISVISSGMAESGEVIQYLPTEIGEPADIEKSSRAIIAGLVVLLGAMLRTAMKKFFEYNEVK